MSVRAAWAGAALAALLASGAASALPSHVAERIVAVVGEKPILLSELKERARPFLLRIKATVSAGAQQTAAESQAYTELLRKMMDEELIAVAAEQARITVPSEEVDRALLEVAKSNQLDVPHLLVVAETQGMSEALYRAELQRQMLDYKLFQIYSRKHPFTAKAGTDAEKREEAHTQWIKVLRAATYQEESL